MVSAQGVHRARLGAQWSSVCQDSGSEEPWVGSQRSLLWFCLEDFRGSGLPTGCHPHVARQQPGPCAQGPRVPRAQVPSEQQSLQPSKGGSFAVPAGSP